jgi:hypothetical protein
MVTDFLGLTVSHCVARSLGCSFFKNFLERLERFQRFDDHSETENGLVKLNILNISSEIKCSSQNTNKQVGLFALWDRARPSIGSSVHFMGLGARSEMLDSAPGGGAPIERSGRPFKTEILKGPFFFKS